MMKVYAAKIWTNEVKKKTNYKCSECGSEEDLQATHIRPPSLGGKRTLDNGVALCVICRTKRILTSNKVRFNFSIPMSLFHRLNDYCQNSGRSINDVIKQLVADFGMSPTARYDHSKSELGEKNEKRIRVLVLHQVFERFAKKCIDETASQASVIRALIVEHLMQFRGGE